MKKLLLLGLCLCLYISNTSNAQKVTTTTTRTVRIVKIKPKTPTYNKIVSPGANYIYVSEDWTWNPATNEWEWNGNRWVLLPPAEKTWVPGHWINTSEGWAWIDGYWK